MGVGGVGVGSELPVLWHFVLQAGFQVGLSNSTRAPGTARGYARPAGTQPSVPARCYRMCASGLVYAVLFEALV